MKATGDNPNNPSLSYGLLSDVQILERLVATDEKCIFISPLVNPSAQLGPSSLDLHLGTELCTTRITNATHIDLTEKDTVESQLADYYKKRRVTPPDNFVLHPGEFALASTLEFIKLPIDIAGRLEGRSSLGRLGLQVHATAGFVDPEFMGTLTFELINAGRLPLKISPGLRLGQICFFNVTEVQVGYMSKTNSKYGGKLGVEPSRIYDDPEI